MPLLINSLYPVYFLLSFILLPDTKLAQATEWPNGYNCMSSFAASRAFHSIEAVSHENTRLGMNAVTDFRWSVLGVRNPKTPHTSEVSADHKSNPFKIESAGNRLRQLEFDFWSGLNEPPDNSKGQVFAHKIVGIEKIQKYLESRQEVGEALKSFSRVHASSSDYDSSLVRILRKIPTYKGKPELAAFDVFFATGLALQDQTLLFGFLLGVGAREVSGSLIKKFFNPIRIEHFSQIAVAIAAGENAWFYSGENHKILKGIVGKITQGRPVFSADVNLLDNTFLLPRFLSTKVLYDAFIYRDPESGEPVFVEAFRLDVPHRPMNSGPKKRVRKRLEILSPALKPAYQTVPVVRQYD